eukprot:jgi/Botrbrau1/5073/Bobra.37_1s0037.1
MLLVGGNLLHRHRLAHGLALILLWSCLSGRSSAAEGGGDADIEAREQRADELYEQAIQILNKRDPSSREMRKAMEMLKDAAGVTIDEKVAATEAGWRLNGTVEAQTDELWTWEDLEVPGVTFGNFTHIGALIEMAYMYEDWHLPGIAYRLLRRAASLGNPQAQGEIGFRMALGLRTPLWDQQGIMFGITEPDTPEALLNYYFAAGANDSFSQMVLGYRHMYGLGVPASCQAAVLYYNPVAEEVIEAARHPEGLPQVEYVKLEDAGAKRLAPSRAQEVLHYQWFADLGHPDAQRRVGPAAQYGSGAEPPAGSPLLSASSTERGRQGDGPSGGTCMPTEREGWWPATRPP